MHSDLGVLVYELELIRDNVHGGLKKNSQIELTHSEVISFARACVKGIESNTIQPFSDWNREYRNRVIFFINLISAYGILHCDRSRAAKKCLEIILEVKEKRNKELDSIEEWDSIPF